MKSRFWTAICCALLVLASASARAEVAEIRIARQYGLAHLPLMVMENRHLIEAAGKKNGLPELKGTFHELASTVGLNEALLAGQLDFAPNGAPSLLQIWDKTRGTANEVRGLVGFNEFTFYLNVNRPGIKSIRDFTPNDRIALSAIKVSVPAIILQMAAAKEWGPENYTKLDMLTVSMSHPDGMLALISKHEITGHFTTPPFMQQELEKPGIYRVLSSDEVFGGATIGSILFGTKKFVEANPKATQALFDAVNEAVDYINNNKKEAAELYLKMSGDKSSLESIVKQLSDGTLVFTTTPHNFMTYAKFMHTIGRTKNLPASWKDCFFPNIYNLPGS